MSDWIKTQKLLVVRFLYPSIEKEKFVRFARKRGFMSMSEYVRALIREDYQKHGGVAGK